MIDPAAVQVMAALGEAYSPERGYGHVVAGDWDLSTRLNEQQRYYRVVVEVMSREIPWRDGESAQEARAEIQAGGSWMGLTTLEGLEERCRRRDQLIASMKRSGCLTQRELRKQRPTSFQPAKIDEINVGIGRDGRFLLIDGRHRFAIARLLELERIPVQVGVRHPDWMTLRREIAEYARHHSGVVPQPLLHPDLDTIPAVPGSREDFEAIVPLLPIDQERVLDIGALWGYHCHRLEAAGHHCVAMEWRPQHRHFLERLRIAGDRRFQVMDDSARDAVDVAGSDFQIGLALEHVEPASATSYLERLLTILQRTPVESLLLRCPRPSDGETAHGRRGLDGSWADRIMAHVGFGRKSPVVEAAGGTIIRLSR